MKYKIIATRKTNKKEKLVLASNVTEKVAREYCECWGWNYSDEKGRGYWLDYEPDIQQELKGLCSVGAMFSLPFLMIFFG